MSQTSPPDPDSGLADSLDLVRLAQRGELVALGELCARSYPRVQALVRQRLNPEMRAEMESGDLLQEAMLDAIRGFADFELRSQRELVGWFARIVENNLVTAARHMRAQKRERARETPLEFVQTYLEESAPDWRPLAGGPDPIEVTSQREQQRILAECLAAAIADHNSLAFFADLADPSFRDRYHENLP